MAALMLCKRAGICLPCSIPHCPGCCCIIFGNNFSTLLSRILSSLFGGKTLPKLVRVRSTSCKGLLASFLPFLEKGIIPAFVQLGRDMPDLLDIIPSTVSGIIHDNIKSPQLRAPRRRALSTPLCHFKRSSNNHQREAKNE